jgi:hypothetical protein
MSACTRAPPRVAPAPIQCARPRVGDPVAEGEGGAVLERGVPLADDAQHGARVAADVRHVTWHRHAAGVAVAFAHGLELVLLDRPVQAGGGDHRGGVMRLARVDRAKRLSPASGYLAEPEGSLRLVDPMGGLMADGHGFSFVVRRRAPRLA